MAPNPTGAAGQTSAASAEIGEFLTLQRFRGACDESTAELFFDRGREHQRAARQREQAAKAICGLCPILAECRLVGRADLSLEGIWGGETRTERRAPTASPSPPCQPATLAGGSASSRPSSTRSVPAFMVPPPGWPSRPPRCAACSPSTASTSRPDPWLGGSGRGCRPVAGPMGFAPPSPAELLGWTGPDAGPPAVSHDPACDHPGPLSAAAARGLATGLLGAAAASVVWTPISPTTASARIGGRRYLVVDETDPSGWFTSLGLYQLVSC